MTRASKKLFAALCALLAAACMLVGVALLPTGTAKATTTNITFDGDYSTTDSPAYAAVGGITEMGGNVTTPPGAGVGAAWSEFTSFEGADGKCIRVSIHPWAFTSIRPVVFNTPIDVTEGMNAMTFRIYADLSTGDTYGLTDTLNIGNGSAGIWIYALNETGLKGEGVMIPFDVTQRAWVDFVISGENFERFIDNNNQVTGFKMASGIVNGDNTLILKSGNNAVIYMDTITFGTVDTNELKASDFTDGKATLFTGNGDYDLAYGDRNQYERISIVNGASQSTYSTWKCGTVNLSYNNINGLTVANDGAKYSFADMKAASNDGYALTAEVSGFGLALYRSILFDKKVKATEVGSLTFRIFANLDNTNDDATGYCEYSSYSGQGSNDPGANNTPYSGIFFFSPDSDCGYNAGVKLNPFVKQREWTEITITGADVLKLADKDGYISGFRFGSAFMSGGDNQLFGGWNNNNLGKNNYDLTACIIIDEITVNAPETVSGSAVLFDGSTAAANTEKTTEVKVEGFFYRNLNSAWSGNSFQGTYELFVDLNDLTASEEGALYDLDEVKAGSDDGHAAGIKFNNWGYTVSPTVYFDKAVKAADVEAVTFRIYANISSAETYGGYNAMTGKFSNSTSMQDTAGIYIYSPDTNSKGDGMLIKGNVKQREWIDLTLSGDDLLKIADDNGMISGFKLGAGLVTAGTAYVYSSKADYDKGNALFIDSVTVSEHDFGEWITAVPATCETDGTVAHYHCSVCGKNFDAEGVEIADLAIAATGHTYGELIAEVPATCTEAGIKAHKDCSVCGKHFDADGNEISDLAIAATGHSFGELIAEVPATCTEAGVKAHKDCSVCGKHFDADGNEIADLAIAATGHSFGEWIAEIPATETAAGTKGHYHCSVCDKDFDREGNEIEDLTIPQLEPTKKGGCGSAINSSVGIATIFGVISVACLIFVIRRKKYN